MERYSIVSSDTPSVASKPFLNIVDNETDAKYIIVSLTLASKNLVRSSLWDHDDALKYANSSSLASENGYVRSYFGFDGATIQSLHRVLVASTFPGDGEEVMEVDHIDRIPWDNRKENLRWVTKSQQQANRRQQETAEKNFPAPEGVDVRLPRFVRWDDTEKKYAFTDHPFVHILKTRHGVTVNTSGTKSAKVSATDKLWHCLHLMMKMFEVARNHGITTRDEIALRRIRLSEEYNALTRLAHEHAPHLFPDGPYVDIATMTWEDDYEEATYRALFSSLPRPSDPEAIGGPRHLKENVAELFEEHDAFAKKKGDTVFVWDAKYHHILDGLNPDHGDMRMFLGKNSPLESLFQTNKPYLKDYVYHVLEKHDIVEGHFVVSMNQFREDVRAKNLVYVKGEGKNFVRSPTYDVCDEVVHRAIPTRFLPRGVCTNIEEITKGNKCYRYLQFLVKNNVTFVDGNNAQEGSRSKVTRVKISNADDVEKDPEAVSGKAIRAYESEVVTKHILGVAEKLNRFKGLDKTRLRAAFDAENEKYQYLLGSYLDMSNGVHTDISFFAR